jgi:hypothetical protein
MTESATYRLFYRAMVERRPLVCMYRERPRAICPIILGHTDGEEKSLVYQFEGDSGSGRPKGWKCLTLSEITHAELVDAPWQDGGGPHGAAQTCVKDVDADVNPDSPYSPKRRIDRSPANDN